MIKQKDIAKDLNVTEASVSYWFSGKTRPSLEAMLHIKKKYKVPIDAWLNIVEWGAKNKKVR